MMRQTLTGKDIEFRRPYLRANTDMVEIENSE